MLVRTLLAYEWELIRDRLPTLPTWGQVGPVVLSSAMAIGATAGSFVITDRISPEPQVLEVMPAEVGMKVAELGETLRALEAHTREIAHNVKPKADIVDRVQGGEDKAWKDLRAKSVHAPVIMATDVEAGIANANQRVASVAADLQLMKDTIESRRTMVRSLPLARPVNGIVTSPFGARTSPIKGKPQVHEGVDIAAPKGSIVVAPADGVVVAVGQQNGYGYSVEIDHGMGVVTVFAHLGRAMIKQGEKVKRGQLIAVVGLTGQTTGPHLHYEVRLDGRAVDPQPFLSFDLARAEAITTMGTPKT